MHAVEHVAGIPANWDRSHWERSSQLPPGASWAGVRPWRRNQT